MSNKDFIKSFYHDIGVHADKHGSINYTRDVRHKYWYLYHYSTCIAIVDPKLKVSERSENAVVYIRKRKFSQTTSKAQSLLATECPWDYDSKTLDEAEFCQLYNEDH